MVLLIVNSSFSRPISVIPGWNPVLPNDLIKFFANLRLHFRELDHIQEKPPQGSRRRFGTGHEHVSKCPGDEVVCANKEFYYYVYILTLEKFIGVN